MRAFLVGLQFLTTLRVVRQQNWTETDCGASVKFFPLIGLVIGMLWAGTWHILQLLGVSPLVTAVLLLIVQAVLTGGLHFDGLMDTADGLFSWRDREQMLEIMKDSRIGGYGALALVLVVLLNVALLADIQAPKMLTTLLVLPVIGRYGMVLAITLFPCARHTGIGVIFARHAGMMTLSVATLMTVIIVTIVSYRWWIAWVGAVCCAWIVARFFVAKLGGLTGDTYGAVTEMTETVGLLLVCLL